jgi:hypothetical protein
MATKGRNMFKGLFLGAILSAVTVQAGANEVINRYYTIKSVKTVELPVAAGETKFSATVSATKKTNFSNLSQADQQCVVAAQKGHQATTLALSPADLAQIIKVGKEVWKIVEANRPVVNVQTDSLAVLPLKAECWRFLEGWQTPVVKRYRTTIKNLFGITVVDFQYKVLALTGGSYRGQGKYLARVAIVPEIVDIAWGYKFNATVSVPTILNYGTVVDPIASVEVDLIYSVDTVLKHSQRTVNYLVKGNGEALEL